MARYIDTTKLMNNMVTFVSPKLAQSIIKAVDETPTEDVAPIIRGKCSITHGMYENRIWCNNCGFIKVITGEEENYNFCPKCGAIVEESGE